MRVYCMNCGYSSGDLPDTYRCPRCGEPLFVEGDTNFKLLDLGQGKTPVIEYPDGLLLKLENLNPTGSFKDRGSMLAVSYAMARGESLVIEDSSGNAGISVAAYAARAGIKARIYVPRDAPAGKLELLRLYGAEVRLCPTRDEAAICAASDKEGYYVSHLVNPLFIYGMRSVVAEIIDFLGGLPDYIVVPVASGSLLLGIWQELRSMKRDAKTRLVAVQACGYETLTRYRIPYLYHECGPGGKSVLADALRLTRPPRVLQMARALLEYNGLVVVVGDTGIRDGLRRLWGGGVSAEPSSAAAYIAAVKLREKIGKKASIVVIVTGSGLKYVGMIKKIL